MSGTSLVEKNSTYARAMEALLETLKHLPIIAVLQGSILQPLAFDRFQGHRESGKVPSKKQL